MKKCNIKGNRAFTLIELLVVILIIGILAAVALPQYQKAVMKARAAEIVLFVKEAQRAMQLYVLENGFPETCINVATNSDKFDITLPIAGLQEKGYSVSVWLCNPSADQSGVSVQSSGLFFSTTSFDSKLQITGVGTSCGGYNASGIAMCKILTGQLGGSCIDVQTESTCR